MTSEEKSCREISMQKKLFRQLYFLIPLIICNTLFAGYWFFLGDNELHSYTFFTIFLDVGYWIFMLPSLIAASFSRFRWYLLALIIFLYMIVIWTAYGTLNV